MFKSTGKSGLRRSSGGSRVARVSGNAKGHVAPLDTQVLRVPAFVPATPQEHGFDSDSPRLGGLETNIKGGNH